MHHIRGNCGALVVQTLGIQPQWTWGVGNLRTVPDLSAQAALALPCRGYRQPQKDTGGLNIAKHLDAIPFPDFVPASQQELGTEMGSGESTPPTPVVGSDGKIWFVPGNCHFSCYSACFVQRTTVMKVIFPSIPNTRFFPPAPLASKVCT